VSNTPVGEMLVGRVGFGESSQACSASYSAEDAMARSIVRLECECEELRAEVAMLKQGMVMLAEERDEARAELEMWRDGNILHEIHRDELQKAEQERDEARMQYRTTELLGFELVKTIDQLKAEKAAIFAQLISLQAGSRRATLDEIAESVREKYEPQHEGEGIENE
jgi:cell division protein FtsB